ncbi:MAG TPA: ATP-binding cassette domain-containing protein [Candidatus Gemmiger faecigallinarum]|nr:ATP-binding cassette domain-containing protein [Candidatus Gemmiger faecigallinarum]
MIEVSHLTKRYGSHCAVDDISFTVSGGGIYGLLGPNGAGKSTTMNVMTGYLSPSSGTVRIDGHDIVEEPREAKACIGYLPEQPPLYTDMTVREYLHFVAELKGVRSKADRAGQIDRAMGRTGLDGVMDRLIRNLSKGYRQRVGIAATLLGDPKVIILDEPTIGLDPAQMIEIRSLIHDLGQTHTVILSSHILSEVQAVCDQVLIIAHGKLIAQGTPEQLAGKLAARGVISATALGSRDAVLAAAGAVPGLTGLQVTAEKGGEVSFTAASAGGADLRAELSRALAEAGCPVTSLTSQTISLEDVFLQLTESPAEPLPGDASAAPAPDVSDTPAADSPDPAPAEELPAEAGTADTAPDGEPEEKEAGEE